jgi:hypothetical protein
MIEELDGLTRVFTRDEVDLFQNFQSATGDIAEVSDGCGDNEEGPHEFKGLTEDVGQLKYFFALV